MENFVQVKDIMLTKDEIRNNALRRRENIDKSTRLELEKLVNGHITGSSIFNAASTVALYAPIKGEVNVLSLLEIDGKVFVFPRVEGSSINFYPVSSLNDLKRGSFGIMEPINGNKVDPLKIDLVLVPGVVFDISGFRLGYGKGYFDRLIKGYPSMTTMGVCFEDFLVDALPRDPWDTQVDYIVTENGLYITRGERS